MTTPKLFYQIYPKKIILQRPPKPSAPHSRPYLLLLIALLSGLLFTTASCVPAKPGAANTKSAPPLAIQAFLLGTIINITFYEAVDPAIEKTILDRLKTLEAMLSMHLDTSDLSKVNASAGLAPVSAPPELYTVVQAAQAMATASNGAFDPTIAPLVKAWDIGGTPRKPSPAEIATILPLINWHDLVLNPETSQIYLQRPGMAIDLGAIAKGFAADQIAEICRSQNVKAALIDLGGNIFAIGQPPGRDFWRLGLQDPLAPRGTILARIEGRDMTIVSSGVYERFFDFEGQRYHHLLDPSTGYPASNGLLQVSIISQKSSMTADALSTACFVSGLKKGLALLATMPDYQGVFVDDQHKVYCTPGIAGKVELLAAGYEWADPAMAP